MEKSDNAVATNKAWYDRKSKKRDMVIQFNISHSAHNHAVYLMSYKTKFFKIKLFFSFIYKLIFRTILSNVLVSTPAFYLGDPG
jgi:hypothetical protein